MNIMALIMLIFAILGAVDYIIDNKFGIGKEFEKGFMMLGTVALTMFGMIIISPLIAKFFNPFFNAIYNVLNIDPSLLTSSILANDMGGAALATQVAKTESIGLFNGLIVGAMMGATVSFTLPVAMTCVRKEKQKELLLGVLCGVVTIPIGCFVSGLILKLSLKILLLNLLPIFIFALIIASGLLFLPKLCVKIFQVLGVLIKILVVVGLVLGVIKFVTGYEVIKGIGDIGYAVEIGISIAVTMAGAFPLIKILSLLLSKPFEKLSNLLKVNKTSTIGFISSLATSLTTFEMMDEMDSKGTVLNAAFAVSAAFILADHLAFTLAFESSYVFPMMIGKIVSGISAFMFALFMYKRLGNSSYLKSDKTTKE